jgi:GNAT superfamily N-acetyltransferase
MDAPTLRRMQAVTEATGESRGRGHRSTSAISHGCGSSIAGASTSGAYASGNATGPTSAGRGCGWRIRRRRRKSGLASAVCGFALRRLREEGATQAVVYADVDRQNPGPKALYESIGFVETSRLVRYMRDG